MNLLFLLLPSLFLGTPTLHKQDQPSIRIQVLSPRLIRLEERGTTGFEDRPTFNIPSRSMKPLKTVEVAPGITEVPLTDDVILKLSSSQTIAKSALVGGGKILARITVQPKPQDPLPSPANVGASFQIVDSPRIVPSAWGATSLPGNNSLPPELQATSGWDLGNQARDVYVWLNDGSGYKGLRQDVLKLTGKVPMPPLWSFGLWNSRYYPYKQQEVFEVIDKYREDGFPLDVFVVDTDWRVGASHGYKINEECFPNMEQFFKDVKDKNIHTMFNDHPEPQATTALDPVEMNYRFDNLTALLNMGLDTWWFDRNWMVTLKEPAKGLPKELWGMAVYHDTQARTRPGVRPMVMSNVPGIDNGKRNWVTPLASHRYPIWWTGDTSATWAFLRAGVENGVESGVTGLLPYVNEDLGGHIGKPSQELYARYLQYGALSPITRLHCTAGQTRYPWVFAGEPEAIAREYVQMRYRLLPTLYSAARRAYDDGTPLLRRCDLEWPGFSEAANNDQYLLGDDILVAPVVDGPVRDYKPIPAELFHSAAGGKGLQVSYWKNQEFQGVPFKVDNHGTLGHEVMPPNVLFKGMPQENWSARYEGTLGPVPETGIYVFNLTVDDGAKLWVKDVKIIDEWRGQPPTEFQGKIRLEKGETVPFRLDYNQLGGGAYLKLEWNLDKAEDPPTERTLWLPPGNWHDAWTGKYRQGPGAVTLNCPLWFTPMFVRDGGLVLTAPQPKESTADFKGNSFIVDAYVSDRNVETTRMLYLDDGVTNDYTNETFAQIPLHLSRQGAIMSLNIGERAGLFKTDKIDYLVRLHVPADAKGLGASLDGTPSEVIKVGNASTYNWNAQVPFKGEGQKPWGEDSVVYELRLSGLDTDKAHVLTLNLQ